MIYNSFVFLTGILVGVIGFALSLQALALVGAGVCAGSSSVQLLGGLWGYLPATLKGEKPTMENSIVPVLVYLAQCVASWALVSKLGFLDFNPQAMRAAVFLYLPTLLILLFQMRVSAGESAVIFYNRLLVVSLVMVSLTFLFFLTPEKKLAQRFYASQPERLQVLMEEIAKRTPKPKLKKKPTNIKQEEEKK